MISVVLRHGRHLDAIRSCELGRLDFPGTLNAGFEPGTAAFLRGWARVLAIFRGTRVLKGNARKTGEGALVWARFRRARVEKSGIKPWISRIQPEPRALFVIF